MSRTELRRQAKLAEQAQRWDDMMKFMAKLCNNLEKSEDLSSEERNLLGLSFKQVISQKRASWRVVDSVEYSVAGNSREVELTHNFKANIEKEIQAICEQIIGLLDEKLLPRAKSVEAKVFLNKLKGDYYRYLSEIKAPEVQIEPMKLAEESYDEAYIACLSSSDLKPSHPVRLGLALNFAVFKYEILKQPTAALDMAREAFEMGLRDLQKAGGNDSLYSDSKFIIQLLSDNISLWANGEED